MENSDKILRITIAGGSIVEYNNSLFCKFCQAKSIVCPDGVDPNNFFCNDVCAASYRLEKRIIELERIIFKNQ